MTSPHEPHKEETLAPIQPASGERERDAASAEHDEPILATTGDQQPTEFFQEPSLPGNAEEIGTGETEAIAINPFAAPVHTSAPQIIARVGDSPLVARTRRGNGNDLILSALLATLAAFFLPFGFLLEFISLFLLIRVLVTKSKPSTGWVVTGIVLSMWNGLRLALWALLILVSMIG